MFRGREMYHPERGRSLLLRLAEDVKDLAMIESDPLQDGRNMVMMLAPHKEAVAVKPASEGGDEESGAARVETSETAPSETAPAAETTGDAPDEDAAAPEAVAPEAETPEPESEPEVEAETQAETPVTPA
jgi:translation initiation factor IF-3